MLLGSYVFKLKISTVYFYDFCERQNHCPKSKNYHFGNTGTERLSLNGNPRVDLQFVKTISA